MAGMKQPLPLYLTSFFTEVFTNYMPSPRPRNLGRVPTGLLVEPPHHMNSEPLPGLPGRLLTRYLSVVESSASSPSP